MIKIKEIQYMIIEGSKFIIKKIMQKKTDF